MINTLHDLSRRWRARADALDAEIARTDDAAVKAALLVGIEPLRRCLLELCTAVADARPAPLGEAATAALYRWSPRLVAILDLAIEAGEAHKARARRAPWSDDHLAGVAYRLGALADPAFLNDIYALFKDLEARRSAGA